MAEEAVMSASVVIFRYCRIERIAFALGAFMTLFPLALAFSWRSRRGLPRLNTRRV